MHLHVKTFALTDIFTAVFNRLPKPLALRLAAAGILASALVPQASAGERAVVWTFGALPEALSVEGEHELIRRGENMTIAVPRTTARPGERWLDLLVAVHPREARAEWVALRVSIFAIDAPGSDPVAQRTQVPAPGWAVDQAAGKAILRVDLRRLGLERARLRLEMFHQAQRGGAFIAAEEFLIGAAGPALDWTPERRVPIGIDSPETAGSTAPLPVTFGLPVPAGAVWDANAVRLVDAQGKEIPSQREITGLWAEQGSAKWIRFDALVPTTTPVFVEPVPADRDLAPEQPLQIRETGDGRLILHTGVSTFVLGAGRSPIQRIEHLGREVASAGARGLYVVDQRNRLATATMATDVRVEARGPLAASVRFEGDYRTEDGETLARHITRIEAFAGQAEARITHTFILTRDTNEVWFKEIGWEFDVDTGAEPRALFGVSREQWREATQVSLDDGLSGAAYVFQEDHVQFGGGKNRFVVATDSPKGGMTLLHQGDEMSDWASLFGTGGGLSIACRESARQHPKELLVEPRRITLKLFSNRGGEELDFRPAALAARWDRGGRLVEGRHGRILKPDESLAPVVEETPTNALGWARTHQLTITPLAADSAQDQSIESARIHAAPTFALADPRWLYETRIHGPLHPRDPVRFPVAEQFIDAAFDPYFARAHERDGEYGFIDYSAGPHYREMGMYRYDHTYNVRPAAWMLYARSGDRRIREWITDSTMTYTDGAMTHWSDPADPDFRRIPGLYAGRGPVIMMMAPYYWGEQSHPYKGDGQASNSILAMQYHLTGYRRAADVLELYGEGLKRWWRPGRSVAYLCRLLRNIHNAYIHQWDPELRLIFEDFAQRFYDAESTVYTNKDSWGHARILYKTPEHLSIPIKLWESLGDKRFYNMALAWSRANFYGESYPDSRLGFDPLSGRSEKGRAAHFLYQEAGQKHLVEEMLLAINRSIPGRSGSISSINWDLQGIAYGMALVAENDADRESPAAWLAYDDAAAGGEVRIFARKGHYESLDFRTLRVGAIRPAYQSHLLRGSVEANPPHGLGRVRIRKDADGGDYELLASGQRGYNFVFSDSRHPLVLHAEGDWQPAPLEANQWPAIYFRVPESADSPRIHFAGSARLIAPGGAPWPGGPVSGWIDLPNSGIWGFEPVDNKPVRVENIPPFFAFRDPAYHFIPESTLLPEAADAAPRQGGDDE